MWKHKQIKGVFKGSYEIKKNGQRVFNLSQDGHEISFESWQQAKKLGWVKK